jgi:hypothetical protein
MQSKHARVTLELDVGASPIRGSIERGGRSRRFEGWIELASLIDAAAQVPTSGDRTRKVAQP